MTMDIKEMVDFVKSNNIEEQLYISAKYLLKNEEFELYVKGLSSYTDGKEIVIGLPYGLVEVSNPRELFIFLMGSMGNQVQHILSTPRDEFEGMQKKIQENMRKEKINTNIAKNVSYSILNSLEDARVENILVNNKKGFLKYIKYTRYKYYISSKLEQDELYDFLNSLYIYSTTGLFPIGFKEMYQDTKLEKIMYNIKNDIDSATYVRTCRECMEIGQRIGNKVVDYLKELVGEDETEIDEARMPQQRASSGEEEKEFNINNENSSKIEDMVKDENVDENEDIDIDENILDSNFKDVFNELKDILEKNMNEDSNKDESIIKKEIEVSKKETENIENYYLGKGAAPDSSIEIKKVVDETDKVDTKVELPLDIKKRAKKFNREIIEIMEERKKPTRRNQKRGIIDTNSLYRFYIFDDTDIFVKKGRENQLDTVFYFLVDGSGSMKENNKWEYAVETMAVLEEALKQIVKIKVAVFNTSWKSTQHVIIKGFNDNIKNKNLIYTRYKNEDIVAGGANKDGANIRIATRELEKRNEKQKILFILSDGMPSAYQYNGQFAIDDVKGAVKEARDKNIEVISIMFGSREFRKKYFNLYKEMYEKNIISTEPSEIFSKIIRVLKDIFANSN